MKYCDICKVGSKKAAEFRANAYEHLKRQADHFCCLEHVGSMTRRLIKDHDTVAMRRIPKED
jgi:hypothetical protein